MSWRYDADSPRRDTSLPAEEQVQGMFLDHPTPWRELRPGRVMTMLLLLALAIVVVVVVLLLGWKVLHQTPWMAAPDRVNACGRRYSAAEVPPVRRDAALREAPQVVGTVKTWRGAKRVWGVRGVTTCGLGVYVETGPDTFRGYQLLGGP